MILLDGVWDPSSALAGGGPSAAVAGGKRCRSGEASGECQDRTALREVYGTWSVPSAVSEGGVQPPVGAREAPRTLRLKEMDTQRRRPRVAVHVWGCSSR